MKQKKKMKPLKDLVLLDRFLFGAAMEDPLICKYLLDTILGRNMLFRVNAESRTEKGFRNHPDLRSIRLDVYTVDDQENVYNTEVQGKDTKNLPKKAASINP